MKKHIRTLILVTVVSLTFGLITACNNKKEEASSPVTATETEETQDEPPISEETETPPTTEQTSENEQTAEKETLMVELGNDMGHNLSALWIRATEKDEWTEIALENNVWQTGYLIPVKLQADSIPNPENGWQVKIEYADDNTTHIFQDVLLNTKTSIILTEDGPIY